MSTQETPKWYLEVESNKTGPYSFEQIQGLYHEGEILGHHRVTADELQGEWITVEQMVQQNHTQAPSEPSTNNSSPMGFRPPPRPPEMPRGPKPTRADPSVSLFDTLQAARDKKAAAKLSPPSDASWAPRPERKRRLPPQFWSILALIVIVLLLIWGIARLFKTPTQDLSKKDNTSRSAPVPAAVAPPPGSLPAPKVSPRTPYTPPRRSGGSIRIETNSREEILQIEDDRDRNDREREMDAERDQDPGLQPPAPSVPLPDSTMPQNHLEEAGTHPGDLGQQPSVPPIAPPTE